MEETKKGEYINIASKVSLIFILMSHYAYELTSFKFQLMVEIRMEKKNGLWIRTRKKKIKGLPRTLNSQVVDNSDTVTRL